MRRVFSAVAIGLTAVSLAYPGAGQHVLGFKDKNGMRVQATGVSRVVSGNNVTYMLDKNVVVVSERQGLTLTANSAVAKAVSDANSKNGELLSTATASGQVHFDKVVSTTQGKQTTHITGSKADYLDGTAESTVKLAGPVSIESQDSTNAQNLTATGSTGTAYLERTNHSTGNSGLKRAILKGSVHVNVDRKKTPKQKALSLRTTSDQATIENLGVRQRITLIGNVNITGEDLGTSSGIARAVILIEKDGASSIQADAN